MLIFGYLNSQQYVLNKQKISVWKSAYCAQFIQALKGFMLFHVLYTHTTSYQIARCHVTQFVPKKPGY